MNQTGMSKTLAVPTPATPEITEQLQLSERLTQDLLERIHMLTERLSGVTFPLSGADKESSVAAPTITKVGSIINQNNTRIEVAIRNIDSINSTLAL